MIRNILFCLGFVILALGCHTNSGISSDKEMNELINSFHHKPLIAMKLVSEFEHNSIDNPVFSKTETDTVVTVKTESAYFVKTKYKIYVHDDNVQLHLFYSNKTAMNIKKNKNSELDFYNLISLVNFCSKSCISYTKSNSNSDIIYNIMLPEDNELKAESVILVLSRNGDNSSFKSIAYTSKSGTHKFRNYSESKIEIRLLNYSESDPHQFSLKPTDYYRIDNKKITLQGDYSNYKM